MEESNIKKRKYWKGKLVSEAVYNKRLKQSENGKKRKKEVDALDVLEVKHSQNDTGATSSNFAVNGCRIFNVEYIAKSMFCKFCQKPLQLINITKEIQKGLASILQIRCEGCLLINDISTSSTHINNEGTNIKHDINSQAALACLHTGLGHSHVNKFLNIMDIPAFSSKTYKKHEREMGKVVEAVAEDSCVEAAKTERKLTIERAPELEKILPEDKRGGFFTPDKEPSDVNDNNVVRIIGSLDMGYSGRANGFTYDSANGYSSMIGMQSGKIISYETTNRICRLCEAGHPKDDHDCRLNFYGSAKAMEAHSAVKLITDNPILKDQNIEVGIFVGDNDSSSISAIRQVASHPVLKLSDQNHTSKGVKNMLYKLKTKNLDPDKELSNDSITYFHRCFSYAVAQNKNDIAALAAAIENIPYHAFNKHDKCGSWCGFKKKPETYKHKSVLGGFKNSKLFDALVSEFKRLANNAQQFVGGASTQGNESVNSIMARKAPKSVCYSVSESCDFRYGCTVLQKNEGENYLSEVVKKTSIPVGSNLTKMIASTEKIAEKRKVERKTPKFKQIRQEKKKIRSQLRFRREATEIDTYESNIGLLGDESDKENSPPSHEIIQKKIVSEKYSIVYFDLETAGFHMTADILQIALNSSDQKFSLYIKPTQLISTHASESNGLTSRGHDLFYYGRKVQTVSLSEALQKLLSFLKALENPCIMVAHNCPFDAPRLLRAIQNENLIEDFRIVISSFQDTLKLFKRKFPDRKGSKQLSLTSLASETLSLCTKRAHNAEYDIHMLEELVEKHLTTSDIINTTSSFDEVLRKLNQHELSISIIPSLKPLKDLVSPTIIKRLASAGINYDSILKTYEEGGTESTVKLLQHEENGVPQVIKTKKIMQIILDHCQKVTSPK